MSEDRDIAVLGPIRKEATFTWPHGTFARVARRLRPQVTPQHVRLVALGRATSARVARALERERERLNTTSSAA